MLLYRWSCMLAIRQFLPQSRRSWRRIVTCSFEHGREVTIAVMQRIVIWLLLFGRRSRHGTLGCWTVERRRCTERLRVRLCALLMLWWCDVARGCAVHVIEQ